MRRKTKDKITEILGFDPSFETETMWIWKTVIGEFRLAPIHISDDSFIVFIHNLKPGPVIARICSGINEVIEITTQYNKKVFSMQADIDRYLQIMYAIKWRTEIIGYMEREDHPIAVNLGFFLCLLESFEGRRFCRTPLEIAPVLEGAFYVVKGFKECFF